MGKAEGLLRQLADRMDLQEEPLPGQPVTELWGYGRVLIENHRGIRDYGRERITVKVAFGEIAVAGRDLELTQMTRERLVISGRIRSIEADRREPI